MSRRDSVIIICLVSILAVASVYFGFFGKGDKNITVESEAASGLKTLTSQAEWTAGTNSNTDLATSPGSVKIDDKTSGQIDLVAFYLAHPESVTTNFNESTKGNLVDGDTATSWSSGTDLDTEYYWKIDLQSIYTLSQINIYSYSTDWWRKVDVSPDDIT